MSNLDDFKQDHYVSFSFPTALKMRAKAWIDSIVRARASTIITIPLINEHSSNINKLQLN